MPQAVCELDDGLKKIKRVIARKRADTDYPVIVGIAGPSSSGKTTKVAKVLQGYFPNSSRILSVDDWYKGISLMRKLGISSFDDPLAVELELLSLQLNDVKNNLPIWKPIYSFQTDERVGYENFEPAKIIILEGLLALFDGIVEKLYLKVFVDVDIHGSLMRRLIRDPEKRGKPERDVLWLYADTVYPDYRRYVEPTKSRANIVIVNNYNPFIEAYGCRSREIQARIPLPKGPIFPRLESVGFNITSVVLREDRYYAAPHWSMPYFDEIVEIRKESGKYYFIYNGPLLSGFFSPRPKMEFEIDEPLQDALDRLGYRSVLRLETVRQKYVKGEIQAAIDVIDGVVGAFLEFSAVGPKDVPEIISCLDKLGIDIEAVTQKSYLEIAFSALNK